VRNLLGFVPANPLQKMAKFVLGAGSKIVSILVVNQNCNIICSSRAGTHSGLDQV
jgi:hypothetical protein